MENNNKGYYPKMSRQETVSELSNFLAEEGISIEELSVFHKNQKIVTENAAFNPSDISPPIKSNFELTNELRELTLRFAKMEQKLQKDFIDPRYNNNSGYSNTSGSAVHFGGGGVLMHESGAGKVIAGDNKSLGGVGGGGVTNDK